MWLLVWVWGQAGGRQGQWAGWQANEVMLAKRGNSIEYITPTRKYIQLSGS